MGRHTIQPLVDDGYEVHAIATRYSDSSVHPCVAVHICDLLDHRSIEQLVSSVGATHLLHLAWYAEPGQFWTSPENLRWLSASLELTRLFAEHGGERAVYAGTCAEYDWSNGACDEDVTPLRPATLYGCCKGALLRVLEKASDEIGLSIGWGRLFFLYGKHESRERLVPSVILSLLRDQPALCTHGGQVRDFLYVQDAADALATLLDSSFHGAVNIASGQSTTVSEVIQTIADVIERKDLLRMGARELPEHEPMSITANIARLSEALGFRPHVPLRTGIEAAVDYWRKQLELNSDV